MDTRRYSPDFFSPGQGTFCEPGCSNRSGDMPPVVFRNQAGWVCPKDQLFSGDRCNSTCLLRGPFLPSFSFLECQANGSWGGQTSCTNTTIFRTGVAFYRCPFYRTWTGAMELAARYSFVGLVGQLPAVQSLAENDLIVTLGAQENMWLGGSRDELLVSNGVFWASESLRGTQIYRGYVDNGGPVNASVFTYFAQNQPPITGGVLATTDGPEGQWYVGVGEYLSAPFYAHTF